LPGFLADQRRKWALTAVAATGLPSLAGNADREKMLEFEGAARRVGIFLGCGARHGRFVHTDRFGDLPLQ
jgi:hypothetical protein